MLEPMIDKRTEIQNSVMDPLMAREVERETIEELLSDGGPRLVRQDKVRQD